MDKHLFLKVIVLTVVFGLGAGFVGQLIATAYFTPGENFIFGTASHVGNVTSQTVEDQKIADAERSVSPSVLEIFPQKNTSHDPLGQVYLPGDRTAFAIALTSDGWLVSFGQNLIDPKNHFVIITQDQKIFSPQKIILDDATGAVFIKIETQNLVVSKLGDYENLTLGEGVLIPTSKDSFLTTHITNLNYEQIDNQSDLLKSSEKLSQLILLDGAISSNEIGAPLANSDGEITGIVSADSPAAAVPINFWRNAFLSILKTEKISRPYLGIHYLDLGNSPGISDAVSQEKTAGALVWSGKNPTVPGVTKNSPAAKVDLRDGDIILKINNDALNPKTDLSELIFGFAPGDKIQITALRNGEEKTFDVTLGEK